MASAVTVQHIGARDLVLIQPHVPSSSSATYWTNNGTTFFWEDMNGYEWLGVIACNAVLTGNGLTAMELDASPGANSTNAQAVIASVTYTGTLVGNGGFLELEAAQLREVGAAAGYTLRYVTPKITVANSSDVLAVCMIRSLAKHPQLNLTPASM